MTTQRIETFEFPFARGEVTALRTGPETVVTMYTPSDGFWPSRREVIDALARTFPGMSYLDSSIASNRVVEIWAVPAEEGSEVPDAEGEEAE